MAKLIFKKDGEETISVIHPVAREQIELELGVPFESEQAYMDFVQQRSQPRDENDLPIQGAWRQCEEADIPASREFRNAWVDTQPGTQIDIDCNRAEAIVREEMAAEHKQNLKKLNADLEVAQDSNNAAEAAQIQAKINAKKGALASQMAVLNAMNNAGKVNDAAALQALRDARDAYKNA